MQYEGSGALERGEPVPFRLTRNLATLFTPFGVEGVFITTMVAAAQVGDRALCRRCHTRCTAKSRTSRNPGSVDEGCS